MNVVSDSQNCITQWIGAFYTFVLFLKSKYQGKQDKEKPYNMKPEIGISKEHLHQNIDLLASILADEIILQVKTRKFHWNVDGESFMELHLLFQNQIVSLEEMIDQVAERIGKLGGKTIGTLKEFLAITRLKESPDKYPAQKDMLQELLADHETVIVEVRKVLKECEKNKDAGTLDFLTGIIQKHETIAWVLRRYLK